MPDESVPALQPHLTSARLVLEPLVAAHASLLYPHLLDERLYRFIPQDPPSSENALRDRYRRLETRRSPDGEEMWLNWVMRLTQTDAYVGTLEATVYPNRTAEVAYMVFSAHQGSGYATEGLQRVLDYLVAVAKVRTIAVQIDTRNTASIALVERLGFHRKVMIRDADFFKGATSDEFHYEMLR
jgi:RimJ/RimL family protein N-acetyltransferase